MGKVMIMQNYPCWKIIDLLLLEHRKKTWKINNKIEYPRFLPHSKKYLNDWIANNLPETVLLMAADMMKSLARPKMLSSRYKQFHPDIWSILYDPVIREQIELDTLFGISDKEIWERLNAKIKPRVIDHLAVKQFMYFFWNLEDCNGVFRPSKVQEIINSNRELSKAYGHILKYFNDKQGRKKYEYHYQINKPNEPDITIINTVIDLTAFDQLNALDKSNFDKLETLTNIQLKNSIVFKTLKTVLNDSGKQNLADLMKFEDK